MVDSSSPQTTLWQKILAVLLVIQWGPGASLVRTDCLLACLLMIGKFYGKMYGLTVDDLSKQTYLIYKDVGLQPEVGVTVGLLHGLRLYVHANTTPEDIRAEIDAGRPVIALVHYGLISNKPWDTRDNNVLSDGHFLVIGSYSYKTSVQGAVLENNFGCFDPDVIVSYTDKGRNIFYSVTDIVAAMKGYGSKCLFANEVQKMSAKEQLHALLNQANALIDMLPDPPPPVVVPPPAGSKPGTITDNGVRVRSAPGTASVVEGTVNRGDALDFDPAPHDANGFNWIKVVTPGSAWENFYIADAYVHFS